MAIKYLYTLALALPIVSQAAATNVLQDPVTIVLQTPSPPGHEQKLARELADLVDRNYNRLPAYDELKIDSGRYIPNTSYGTIYHSDNRHLLGRTDSLVRSVTARDSLILHQPSGAIVQVLLETYLTSIKLTLHNVSEPNVEYYTTDLKGNLMEAYSGLQRAMPLNEDALAAERMDPATIARHMERYIGNLNIMISAVNEVLK